jgi:hypothetical protein
MKTVLKLVALASVMVVWGSASAQASTIEVKVPFPFLVQHRMLPAGEYLVEQPSADVLFIHGERGTTDGAYVLARPDAAAYLPGDRPLLTFTKYEKEWRLSAVQDPGADQDMIVAR